MLSKKGPPAAELPMEGCSRNDTGTWRCQTSIATNLTYGSGSGAAFFL
jgi:hypothetical protein